MRTKFIDWNNSTLPNTTNGVKDADEALILPKLSASSNRKFAAIDIAWLAEAAMERDRAFVGAWWKTNAFTPSESTTTVTTPMSRSGDTSLQLTKNITASQINSIANRFVNIRYIGPNEDRKDAAYFTSGDFTDTGFIQADNSEAVMEQHVYPRRLAALPSGYCNVTYNTPVTTSPLYVPGVSDGLYNETQRMNTAYLKTGGIYWDYFAQVIDSDTCGGESPLDPTDPYTAGINEFICDVSKNGRDEPLKGKSGYVSSNPPQNFQPFLAVPSDLIENPKLYGLFTFNHNAWLYDNVNPGNNYYIHGVYYRLMRIDDGYLCYFSDNGSEHRCYWGGDGEHGDPYFDLLDEYGTLVGIPQTKASDVRVSNNFELYREMKINLYTTFLTGTISRNARL